MSNTTFDIETSIDKDNLAVAISNKWTEWNNGKANWEGTYQEILQYIFANKTDDIISQRSSEWASNTHIPKLTQLRDTLITYYLESLFSLQNYVVWIGETIDDITIKKRTAIQKFMQQMLEDGKFRQIVSELVEDYVDSGNAFAMPVWIEEKFGIDGYWEGVKACRIDPLDIMFDAQATNFEKTTKIVRKIVSIGELKELSETNDTAKAAFQRIKSNRDMVRAAMTNGDQIKENMIDIAGFSSYSEYLSSDTVELLTVYGTVYDITSDTLYKDKIITIADRAVVLSNEDMPQLSSNNMIFKAGWRDRKNCLWAQSPLENLLGMQYRIDLLENKRADVYDYISNPILKTKGDVSLPEHLGPGSEINCDTNGDASFMSPDATILTADTYINLYEQKMDLYAGAPREAIGFRTPGEKTAFEVQQIMNAAARLFVRKIRKFEVELFEPLLNSMLQLYLSKKQGSTVSIKSWNADYDVETIDTISVDDLRGVGSLKAVGSTYYSDKSQVAQSLMSLGGNPLFMDAAVLANISPAVMGRIFLHVTDLDKYPDLYKTNARIFEMAEQQKVTQRMLQQVDEEQARALQQTQERTGVDMTQVAQQGAQTNV